MNNIGKFSTFIAKNDYDLFVEAVDAYIQNPTLVESNINEGLMDYFKDKLDFIKQVAEKFSMNLTDMLLAFKNKIVFGFFSKIGWSITKLVDIVATGRKVIKEMHNIIFKWAKDNKIVQWTNDKIELLDKFLTEHPTLKKVTGLAVAGLLLYIWTNLISFTGEIDFDFDQIGVWHALNGTYNLVDLFGGEDGIKLLTFIITKKLDLFDVPYPGASWALLTFSVIFTICKYNAPSIANAMKPMLKKVASLKK
jgi:hypothetical protein